MELRSLAGDLKALKTLAALSGRSKKRRAEEDTVIEAALLAFEGFDEEELEAIKHARQGAGVPPGGQQRDGPDRLLEEHLGPDAA